MYSLTVSPAFCACICRMSFSSLVTRMWISDVTPCARLGRGIVPCPFRGVSGRSPERDAQPFLRVAEGGLEKWWWRRKTPQGFCGYSAYLAVSLNDSGLPGNSSDFTIIHIFGQLCAILFSACSSKEKEEGR